jgi:hypothetical protein
MLLDHLGHPAIAGGVRTAVTAALAAGDVRLRADGSAQGGAGAVADAVVEHLPAAS